ncbi:tyrosine-type recombinase/integrase [Streptomyces sp. NPDC090798]|uniref:tyrosine-type recombinase/integrase n=1 Tax=Streptomyces sp. NPDC090798 TaxID=3365968 RepID=UPI0037FA9810
MIRPGRGRQILLFGMLALVCGALLLLLVSPELADVLSTIIRRVRDAGGAVPMVTAYDIHERVWNPPMPLLFQYRYVTEHRQVTAHAIRGMINGVLVGAGLTGPDGEPLRPQPHDFRRMLVTDVVSNGLPPHIAQVICGHSDINTTMGYKAIYPQEAIEAHRSFITRRRASRPSEEYRTPTEEEWEKFLGHFERRKVSIGTCGRAFDTPCIHEHACVRCSVLRPDPTQRPRLVEIIDNLNARIEVTEREGWLGEVEGLQVSLAGAKAKLAQIDQRTTVTLGVPDLSRITGRTVTSNGQGDL